MRTTRIQNKNKKFFEIKNYHLILLIFFATSILFVYMNKLYLLSGSDFGFHRLRLLGLVQSIENKDFFPKINYIMANGLGYGVPIFYGQWFLYFPALLMSCLHFTFTHSWLTLYILYYITMLSLNYYIGKKVSMSTFRSIIFSLLLVFNPLITSIVNGDLPFAICLMLTPALFYCLWRILYFNENFVVILAILMTIIFNTHILSTLMIVFIGFLWVGINFKKLTVKKTITFIKSILLFSLLSISFWFPLLEQITAQELKGSGLSDAFRYASVQPLSNIFINSFSDSITSISRYPTISLVGLILYIFSLIYYMKSDEVTQKIIFLSSFLLIFSSELFPWAFFGHTSIGAVQFVGRYLVFTTVLIIFSSLQNKNIPNLVLLLCLCLTFLSTISQQVLPKFSNETNFNEYISNLKTEENKKISNLNDVYDLIYNHKQVNGIAGGEYINNSADLTLSNDEMVKSETADIINVKRKHGYIAFDYISPKNVDSSKILIPFLWYKGYVAEYSNNSKGTQPFLDLETSTGKIKNDGKLTIKVEGNGHVQILYHKTLIQIISAVITVASWLTLFSFIFKTKFK